MNVWMIFKVSILAILRNKTCSLLTCIGIIVGIAAVIAVLAIGKGASTMMVKEISSMGNNLVMVWPDWNRRGTVRAGAGAKGVAIRFNRFDKQIKGAVGIHSLKAVFGGSLLYKSRSFNETALIKQSFKSFSGTGFTLCFYGIS